MARIFSLIAWVLSLTLPVIAQPLVLESPDGRIKVGIALQEALHFSVQMDGRPVVTGVKASLEVGGNVLPGQASRLKSSSSRTVNRILHPAVREKSARISDHFNELTLDFGHYGVVFRAYDNGVAYRFVTRMQKAITVTAEQMQIGFPEGTQTWYPEEKPYRPGSRDQPGFLSHNERNYLLYPIESIAPQQLASLPVLAGLPGGGKVLITESDLRDYPGMWLRGTGGRALQAVFPPYPEQVAMQEGSDRTEEVIRYAPWLTRTSGSRAFPWRLLILARHDGDLLTSQLVYLLAGEQELEDTGWIKPGKVAWDWWNANNLFGVDFEAGINNETYRYYIDFAAKYGIEYVILDEGWYHLGDLTSVVPEIDVPELVAYGRERNVGIILWVVWKTLDEQLEEALLQFEQWGVSGIKVDFMQRDDQQMVNFYEKIAREAATHHLLVDFHGAFKPAGLRRRYPNVLTREGVKGLEHNKWSRDITPTHNLTLPFVRMVAGPMDYTPGAMVNARPDNFRVVFTRPMSMTTRVQQMAMYVIYESPLQMLADSPSQYLREPECTAFIAAVPVEWDETRVLQARVGEYIGLARRRGDEWFVGLMTNEEPQDFTLGFDFLPPGNYRMEYFADGPNAHRYASDYQRHSRPVSSGDSLTVKLAPGGGWVARITPQ